MDAWKMTNSNGNYTPNNNQRRNGEALRHGNVRRVAMTVEKLNS